MENFTAVLHQTANCIAAAGIIPIALFIYFYGSKRAPGSRWRRVYTDRWRATGIGRTLMYQKIAMFVLLFMVVVNLFVRDYPMQEMVRFCVYLSLFTLFWRMLIQLRRAQNVQDHEDSKPAPHNGVL